MAFLLDLLKEAYNVYSEMESDRYFPKLRRKKAYILKELFDTHNADSSYSNEKLATAIIQFSNDKQDNRINGKFKTILDILTECSLIILGTPADSKAESIQNLVAVFQNDFADVPGNDYFVKKINHFVRHNDKLTAANNAVLNAQNEIFALRNSEQKLKAELNHLEIELKNLRNQPKPIIQATVNNEQAQKIKLLEKQLEDERKAKQDIFTLWQNEAKSSGGINKTSSPINKSTLPIRTPTSFSLHNNLFKPNPVLASPPPVTVSQLFKEFYTTIATVPKPNDSLHTKPKL